MASSHLPTFPQQAHPRRDSLPVTIEVVWGAPSDEMLDAEARGEIILVEDIQRRSLTSASADRHGFRD
jgi:hypothetical protein